MIEPVELVGRHVRLVPLVEAHIAGLVAAAAESRDHYGFTWVPDGLGATRDYVTEALADHAKGKCLPFVHLQAVDGTIIGTTRFTETEPWLWPPGHLQQRFDRPDAVEIGSTWLAASAQRTGVNTEAKFLMFAHAFETWEVHRVSLCTDARNARSRAAIERIGATFEGIRRAEQPGADGTLRDTAYFSVVAREWPAVRAHLRGLLDR